VLSARDRLALLRTLASLEDQTLTREQPTLECRLAPYGVRVAGAIPPVTTAPTLVMRRSYPHRLRLTDYVKEAAITGGQAHYLRQALRAKKTIVIAGATDSGKTTLTNALLAEIEAEEPDPRLVILEEDVRELVTSSPNAVHLLAGTHQSAQQLLRLCLRMNPDRIVIGEARGPECYQWLRAANTGHPGGLLTLHANSAETVVERIADLIAEAGVSPSLPRIAEAIDVVLFMSKDPATGLRTVSAIRTVSFDGAVTFHIPDLAEEIHP
jgi:type IV secretion system protein VirB11